MAEDGMLLNFTLGAEPFKSHVKYIGGRWRDRQRAEKSARLKSTRPIMDDARYSEERKAKRRRKNPENAHGLPSEAAPSADSTESLPSGETKVALGTSHHPRKPAAEDGQLRHVISRLFSFNPEQMTTAPRKQEEWNAPQPSNAPLEGTSGFQSLGLCSRLADELAKANLHKPTAIQKKVIPHMLSSSSDVFVQAETGSGKTLAYLLPIVHRALLLSSSQDGAQIHRDSGVFAMFILPTRELAKQVHAVLEKLIRSYPWLVSTAITGGESKKAEKARIRKGVNFIVATPGRLADHINNTKALCLSTARWLVLDEGDRLMELGFEEDLKKIISALRAASITEASSDGTSLAALPAKRVTVLCSATMQMNVQKLGEISLADATFLAAGKEDTTPASDAPVHKAPAQLHQSYIIVPSKLRLVTLVAYLKSVFSRRNHTMKAIIFMSCADSVDFHYEILRRPGSSTSELADGESNEPAELISRTTCMAAYIHSAANPEVVLHRMHGSLNQPIRTATLRSYTACKLPSILITTDISSRGLDIPSVDLVVEYDPAFSFAEHLHRVGRTARAGRPGEAMLFLLPGTEEGYLCLLNNSSQSSAVSNEAVLKKGFMTPLEFPVETAATPTDGQSFHDKAETLQLHLEQRLVDDMQRLELARNAFKSHIRAYATHVKDERTCFDITQLHLGHVAKSFALRDAPGGIGANLSRKIAKGHKGPGKEGVQQPKPGESLVKQKSSMLLKASADEFNIG